MASLTAIEDEYQVDFVDAPMACLPAFLDGLPHAPKLTLQSGQDTRRNLFAGLGALLPQPMSLGPVALARTVGAGIRRRQKARARKKGKGRQLHVVDPEWSVGLVHWRIKVDADIVVPVASSGLAEQFH